MALKLQQQLKELGTKLENPPTTKDALLKLLKVLHFSPARTNFTLVIVCFKALHPRFLGEDGFELMEKRQTLDCQGNACIKVCNLIVLDSLKKPAIKKVKRKNDFSSLPSGRQAATCLSEVDQSPTKSMLESMQPFLNSIAKPDLLKHQDREVKLLVATCVCEITRITAPEAPYSDDVLKDIFHLIVSTFSGLSDTSGPSFGRRVVILETLARYRSCVVMLDLECDDLVNQMFNIIRSCPIPNRRATDRSARHPFKKAVRLVGDLFALPGSAFSEPFQPIFLEFLKRLTDRVVEVRMSVLDRAKVCLLSNPFRSEAPQIISALCDRLWLRSAFVTNLYLLKNIPWRGWLRYTGFFCLSQSVASTKTDDFDWIPGKILRCFYDKDFRSDAIEPILCGSLFPDEFSVKERVGCWIRVFSGFDKVEVKALEKILEQKQRGFSLGLQVSTRDAKETEVPEFQKKILFCFRIMSRCFIDPAKAEENFQILDQLKDANIWKILTTLLDPNTSSLQACSCRDDLLKILGEKHRLYDFLTTVSLKCSYLLFNKHHVKEILLEADLQKSAGHTQFTLACMNILVILAHFSPLLLSGIEEDLVHLLKDDNEVIIEGVLHVLANAGGTIQEQLGVSSSSLDLILERICLEGSRRQAKYAVHALAAITKDDGLMSLSVLYKRTFLASAETCGHAGGKDAFARSTTIFGVHCTDCNKVEEQEKDCWDDRSELCSLKIFGIKTLVKSYLPVKDAHLRLGIDSLLDILKNILSFGEISNAIESSPVDKAHLRLVAAKSVLRLSKHWDHKIPVNLFYLTLRTLEINFPQAKKQFLSKVHQYIKERLLDPKYACAFLLDISRSQQPEFEEGKHNLSDIIQTCQQGKARQISLQCDANSVVLYPEYILPYLVHALAHHSSCPNVDECRDVKAFEPVYRQLHLFFSMLIHGDEDGKSEGSIEKDKESICAILSILQCIKCSEDTLDPTKSKNSHGICDLGLSITKRLAQKEDDLQGSIVSVSLPPMLYKPHDKKEVDDPLVNEGQTWLAEKSVLTHFESLKLEVNGTIHPEVVDDVVLEDSETDGNEVPLGKMIKRLKAKGIKARKEVKTEPLQAGTKNEDGVDILQMVREINLGTSGKLEVSNGHEYLEKKIDQKYRKRKEKVASETTNVPVPKRRRSSPQVAYKFSLSRKTSKGSKSTSIDDLPREEGSSFESPEKNDELHVGSEDKMSLQENMVEPAESDLLVTCFWKNSNSLPKHKSRSSDKDQRDKAHKVGEIDDYDVKKINKPVEIDSMKAISNTKSSTASGKKRKRRSIAGLAKCTSKEGGSETMDLINCRIKIWWPMDKKFYEGLVKSYDSQKKKHVSPDSRRSWVHPIISVIVHSVLCMVHLVQVDLFLFSLVLYDDGDVEVLRLEKERWELVDNGHKQKQRSKASKSSPHKGSSSPCKVRGKRTPRRNLKHGLRGGLKSQTSSGLLDAYNSRSPGIPDPEPAVISKLDDMNSGDSEGEHIETGEKSFTGGEESDEDQKSDSEGKLAGDAENVPSDVEESEQEKPNFEVTSHDTRRSTEEGSPRSEEKHQDVSRDGSGEEDGKAEQSDSQGTDADDSESNPTNPDRSGKKRSTSSDSGEAEISEDRPLSTWKRRVAKPVQGK
ncbi:binding protein [Actinidia rufa]|uniref:Binding protein n=1 Tax=Actinidia rufa TaxID=165716 RepID=A0A7J0FZJ3_9ERIC|nr:binding protein [Actinidia rufa]